MWHSKFVFYKCLYGTIMLLYLVLTFHIDFTTASRGIIYTMFQLHTYGSRDVESQNGFLNKYLSTTTVCKRVLKNQKALCLEHTPLIPSIISGFILGLNECQYQFHYHMWNCQGHNLTVTNNAWSRNAKGSAKSSVRRKQVPQQSRESYLDRLIAKSTPESAYILSIISAGVSHQVTKACSQGIYNNCGCDRTVYEAPKNSKFTWSGCSHNIHFGAAFARRFLDVQEIKRMKTTPNIATINMHNNHLGRQSVIDRMKVKCKCHGVSGSCEIKTCSRTLPSFREIGDFLKEKHKSVIQVDYMGKKLVPRYKSAEMFGDTDMIHLSDSPDHCSHNSHAGTIGTSGRICNSTANYYQEPENSCYRLCCQRGYYNKQYQKSETCRCKFKWCCKVICDTCTKDVVDSICN